MYQTSDEIGKNGPKYRYTPRTKKSNNKKRMTPVNDKIIQTPVCILLDCSIHVISMIYILYSRVQWQWQWQQNICTTCVHICTCTIYISSWIQLFFECLHARTHTTHSYVACLVGARKAGDHFVIICVNDVPFSPFQWEILLVFKMLTFLWYKTHSITLGSLSFHGVLFWSATWITISWLVCSSMQCVEFHVCYSTSEIHESENLSENKFDRLLFQISKLHWCAYLCMYSEAWTPL